MRGRYWIIPFALALASGVAAAPLTQPAHAAIDISITVAPPPLPVYDQPPLPGPGYMWTPGYWAYDPVDGYYWVPGTWVEPPEVGLLWTPGYWGWVDGSYAWNAGYWGPTVGFYGGVDYGYGYNGNGFYGGRWDHGHFAYNTAAWNVGGARVANSYREAVPHRGNENHVSYNGGHGGIAARPTAEQERAAHEHHVAATAMQIRQETAARQDPTLRASQNHGKPPVTATARPGEFKGNAAAVTPNARPGANPADHNAALRPGANPAEHNAATRPGIRPEEHNAARRGLNPADRNATVHPGVRPEERNAARPAVNSAERNAARPALRPAEHAARPVQAPRSAMRPPSHRPAATRPAVAHPMARPAIHPAMRPRPAAALHPMARPMVRHAPAARPAPHPAPAAHGPEKKP